ncbi:sigma-70 family RNA polymerase sigma factor family protein [Streptomyces specialis]|uniref:sigma factor n=1 Tax=Streptomyces specialis TaxID=498367 RepID=UPI00073F73EA|nr:sigma factor [Streptomyces specialis]
MIDGSATSPPGVPGTPGDTSARVFADHRDLLFTVVHTLLGSVADTEDVLRETASSWRRTSRRMAGSVDDPDDPRAYLVRIAVNRALARQTGTRARDGGGAGGGPAVAGLTPLERAMVVVHQTFGIRHSEIADILGRRPRYRAVPAGTFAPGDPGPPHGTTPLRSGAPRRRRRAVMVRSAGPSG